MDRRWADVSFVTEGEVAVAVAVAVEGVEGLLSFVWLADSAADKAAV